MMISFVTSKVFTQKKAGSWVVIIQSIRGVRERITTTTDVNLRLTGNFNCITSRLLNKLPESWRDLPYSKYNCKGSEFVFENTVTLFLSLSKVCFVPCSGTGEKACLRVCLLSTEVRLTLTSICWIRTNKRKSAGRLLQSISLLLQVSPLGRSLSCRGGGHRAQTIFMGEFEKCLTTYKYSRHCIFLYPSTWRCKWLSFVFTWRMNSQVNA